MPKVLVVVTGDRKANRALRRLSSKQKRKAIRDAARPALKPVMQQQRSNAKKHKDTGAMAKAIKVRSIPRSRSRIGARTTISDKTMKVDRFYASFQNYGWKAGKAKRKIEGTEFLNKGAEAKRAVTMRRYHESLRRIVKELATG